mgnify:CR=1 FL=1
MPAPEAPAGSARAPGGSRVLVFGSGRRRLALDLADVSGLVEAGSAVPVPLAPDFVVGLLDRRGSVLAVLDLARLLGDGGGPPAPFVVRLAPPWDHLALQVTEPVRIARPGEEREAEPLEASSLVARIQSALPPARS